jgi:hypothetical protein
MICESSRQTMPVSASSVGRHNFVASGRVTGHSGADFRSIVPQRV